MLNTKPDIINFKLSEENNMNKINIGYELKGNQCI